MAVNLAPILPHVTNAKLHTLCQIRHVNPAFKTAILVSINLPAVNVSHYTIWRNKLKCANIT